MRVVVINQHETAHGQHFYRRDLAYWSRSKNDGFPILREEHLLRSIERTVVLGDYPQDSFSPTVKSRPVGIPNENAD